MPESSAENTPANTPAGQIAKAHIDIYEIVGQTWFRDNSTWTMYAKELDSQI
jgi:hypothetical protein